MHKKELGMKTKGIVLVIIGLIAFLLLALVLFGLYTGQNNLEIQETSKYKDKKILVVFSYHAEIQGVINKNKGISSVLDESGVEYKVVYMDTRRNPGEEFKENAALIVKEDIESYDPDVVIVFDDNAFKHLVMPYYKDAELPFVFAGIDWDASIYDAPYTNTAGLVSVDLVSEVIDSLKEYSDGDRVAWLGFDTFTTRKQAKAYEEILGLEMDYYFVSDFEEWKATFLELQSKADMIIQSGILLGDWNNDETRKFVEQNIKVPTGTVDENIMNVSMFGLIKDTSEQGEWSAQTALDILDGKNPSDIPIAHNKKGSAVINFDLAEKLNILFKPDILKNVKAWEN